MGVVDVGSSPGKYFHLPGRTVHRPRLDIVMSSGKNYLFYLISLNCPIPDGGHYFKQCNSASKKISRDVPLPGPEGWNGCLLYCCLHWCSAGTLLHAGPPRFLYSRHCARLGQGFDSPKLIS